MNNMANSVSETTQKIINDVEKTIKKLMNGKRETGEFWVCSDPDAPIVEPCTQRDPREATERKKLFYEFYLKALRVGNWFFDLDLPPFMRRERKNKPITVVYENSLQDGLFEKVLADIYSRKIRNGTIDF